MTFVDLHCAEGNMDRCAAHFNSDCGVQHADSRLEWL